MIEVLTGAAVPAVLLTAGMYFLIKLKAFYFTKPVKTFRLMLGSSKNTGESSYKSVCLALAGTLGVGNIIGVASAVIGGGPGAVFWMIVGALVSAILKYAEIVLSVLYRHEKEGGFYGGAMYYISEGLGSKGAKILGSMFAFLCAVNSLTTGTVIQVNAISAVVCEEYGAAPIVVGLVTLIAVILALIKSDRSISAVTSVLVPLASVTFMAISLTVILKNVTLLPKCFEMIVSCAFGKNQIFSGVGGYAVSSAVRFGISRGLVSNEAGSGTAPTAHARANTKSPAQQGFWGIFEVMADTVIMCTATALVLIIYILKNGSFSTDAVCFTTDAYSIVFGRMTGRILGGCIAVFAYATVICQYFYGVESLRFISVNTVWRYIYSAVFFATVLTGALIGPTIAWTVTDISLSAMTLINVAMIFRLRTKVFAETEKIMGAGHLPCTRKSKHSDF